MIHIILNVLAIWVLMGAFTVIIGVSLANRLPAETDEDSKAFVPPEVIEGASGVYEEPLHIKIKREHWLKVRDRIYVASRRERAEHEAAKRGGV